MSITTEPIPEAKLSKSHDLKEWISKTQKSLRRVPVAGVIENGAAFYDDEYFGDSEVSFRFNEHGFRAFSRKLATVLTSWRCLKRRR